MSVITNCRCKPAKEIRRIEGAIPDYEISPGDLATRPSSEITEVREWGPVQRHTGGEVKGRGVKGNGGRVNIPGRRFCPGGRVDEILGSGKGVDECVDILDNRNDGEEGKGDIW